jgi:23S rRNA (adenine-N6)-dimethyltransferase
MRCLCDPWCASVPWYANPAGCGGTFRVVASPPYGITADLLRLLLTAGPRLRAADLILQRAVVRKYTGQRTPRTYLMSAGLILPRRAFRPPPRVDSAVLLIRRR